MKLKLLSAGILCLALAVPAVTPARIDLGGEKNKKGGVDGPQRILELSGRNVHKVGELLMHVGNWGQFGSWPGSGFSFSEAPSAQWPAGSGVEYLFTSGLWVGAIKSTVPAVSTAAYEFELRPSQDDRDIMYWSAEGAGGGNRLPSRVADDDRDGTIDEDWKNGYDDDGDGQIDEDFAAISKQMFSCQYYDNTAASIRIYPEHNPLNLHIRQESYQWEEDRFDDFIGANFWITNQGEDALTNIYIGFFADGDAGNRTTENYWEDDGSALDRVSLLCTDLGPVSMDIAYTYDVDGDNGQTTGYFGIMFLGHTVDPTGEIAPEKIQISTYANFSGNSSFEEGGDPTNDFERYELLSSTITRRNTTTPRDYRMLMAAGPFSVLEPESTLVFQTAFVIGDRRAGMRVNASNAQLTFNGAWFNLDGNPATGVDGRETPVFGEAFGVVIDSCREELATPIDWLIKDEALWINNDCVKELEALIRCNYTELDSIRYRTGINGQETQINWIVGTAPPPPLLRVHDYAKDGVAIYWDNFSEIVPDVKTQIFDFEGYRVWRAEGWNRPQGTSIDTGPSHDLWQMQFQADVINNFGEDTGLDRYRYEPLVWKHSPSRVRDLVATTAAYLVEHPGRNAPCPQGLNEAECDTVDALARAQVGMDGGRSYYRYIDRIIHRGRPYFYSVTATDHGFEEEDGSLKEGKAGDPASNFIFVEPRTPSQQDYAYSADQVYVVPNPATTESMSPWALEPNNDDPTGIKVEFRNLPAARGVVRVYTLAGDMVIELPFDGTQTGGTVRWDLVSRNAQDITSGVYLYSVESESNAAFKRKIGKFVVIR